MRSRSRLGWRERTPGSGASSPARTEAVTLPRSKRTGRMHDGWLPENIATYGKELD